MDSPKYAAFDVSKTPYKTFNGQKIYAVLFIPKNIPPGKYPVMVKFHGGYFCTGAAEYPGWFCKWVLEYCIRHSAMIIGVNYRLLPESNGFNITQDVVDFWEWSRSKLQEYLRSSAPGIEADLSKVITYGDSAGGYLAIYSAFTQPARSINAVIAMYPVIDPRDIRGNQKYPPSALENHMKAMEPGEVVTAVFPPERLELGILLAQQSRMMEFFRVPESLLQMKSVEKVPYLLILHGDADLVVPVKGSIQFKKEAESFGIKDVALHIKRGGEHGFDKRATLEAPWLAKVLGEATKQWLTVIDGASPW